MSQIKQALRQLKLRPGLSVVVILMLALGIGATTAMFSLYHQILVRPLPVPEPDRLVNLAAPGPKPGGNSQDLGLGNREAQFTYPMFRDLEQAQSGFVGLAAHVDFLANLSFDDRPVSGRGWFVSGSYFDVLNLRPALGRLIGPSDDPRVGESAVTVLTYEFWQRVLGGDPTVIGKTLSVNGQVLEIIGVAPAGFRGTNLGIRADVFVPLTMSPVVNSGLSGPAMFDDREGRRAYWLYLFARLAPGVTLERAAAELNVVYSGILNDVELPELSALQQPGQPLPAGLLDQFRARQIAFSPGSQGQSNLPTTAGRPLTLLLGVTVLVLLIVCVNIANLLLARGAARAGEMATRASLGASRGWLVRQLLTESFVLIAIGGLASLLVAALIVRLITALLPVGLVTGLAPALSSTAMLFAAGASLLTVVVFGLAPAWSVSNTNPALAMKVHAARSGGGRAALRFRGALTTAQIAFSLLLLVLAGLFTKSLMNVAQQDLGVDVDSIVSFSVSPRLNAYSPERLADFHDRLEETLAQQPGVIGVGSAALPILGDFALRQPWSVDGFETAAGANTTAAIGMVGTDFFAALGVPLRAGRVFTDRDTAGAPQVAVVNESFARRFDVTDVGRRLSGGTMPTSYPFEIVGIVADSKHTSIKGETEPVVYVSRYQFAGAAQAMFYYLRAGVDPDALLATIPRVVAEFDPEVPVTNLRTLVVTVQEAVYIDRLLSMLSAGFAALATLLAGIGLYGVLAYNVTQRTRELGLRLALGAAPARLRAMVLKQVGVMALIGATAGFIAALALGRVAESVLFGMSGRDPIVLGSAVAVLGVVVLAGAWLPARRAARIEPTEALRCE
ncbi:MAG TPA: ABC transporter permease [Gammaproteobacteria bacterium]|nr:ABC transporter permease [Gammaproteobacteria bacterium]